MLAHTLLIAGLVLLVIGQMKKDRKLVIVAVAFFVFSLGSNDFVHGLVDGFKGS